MNLGPKGVVGTGVAVSLVFSVATLAWSGLGPATNLWLGIPLVVEVLLSYTYTIFFGPAAYLMSVTANRTPITETLPRSITHPVLIIPVATCLATSMLTLGVTVGSLTLGDNHPYPAVVGPYMAVLCLYGLGIGVGAPLYAMAGIRSERDGTNVAIFDPTQDPKLIISTVANRWQKLAATKRRFASKARYAALGDLRKQPANAWPTQWTGQKTVGPRNSFLVLSFVNIAAFACILLTFNDRHWARYLATAGYVTIPASSFALACLTGAFALLQAEQLRAALLRRANIEAVNMPNAGEPQLTQEADDPPKARFELLKLLFSTTPRPWFKTS